MAFNSDQTNSDRQTLSISLDSQQAETQLAGLRARIVELRALLAGPNGKGLPINLGQAAQTAIQPLQKISGQWAQIAKSATQSNQSVQGFFQNLQNAGNRNSITRLAANTINQLGAALFKNTGSLTQAIGGTLTGALSGAVRGLAGGPIGSLAGAITGALSNLVGSVFGGKAAKEAQKQQQQLQQTKQFIQQVLSQTDEGDLQSLQDALSSVLQYKSGGGAAFQAKRDTAIQLQAAIAKRKAVVDAAIADFSRQNAALNSALRQFDDTPFQNTAIDYSNSLADLQAARDKSLADYKDSAEAQAQIEQNYELKRQALLKASSLDLIDSVVDEQNTIRTLRAQTLVSHAQSSGNAIQLINAQLQAQLVAIDNELSAFKGSEAEKTEFFKAKTAERTAIIQQANTQVTAILQNGLDILNEGLVVGQTKSQNQQQRLQQLFGSLNPLGQIQSGGQLLQSNVTVGAGAVQLSFEGIQDAQSLIAQLSDPTVQAKLLAALNSAIART
jgi:hypothetical protein